MGHVLFDQAAADMSRRMAQMSMCDEVVHAAKRSKEGMWC